MHNRNKQRTWPLVALLAAGMTVAVTVTAACAPDNTGTANKSGATFHTDAHATTAGAAPTRTAADKAIALQALMGQHSVLAADLMRSRIRGDDDFVQSANAALGKNTDDMSGLVGQLFGDAAAKGFAPLWSGHIVLLVSYAGAIGDGDEAAQKKTRADLITAETKLATFFAGASQGRLPLPAAKGAVAAHVDHLTDQADAYATKDYEKADRLYRENFEHTYDLGGVLAGALLPPADAKVLQEPIWRLRSTLGKLLAEHAVLIEDVTRAAVSNSPDFTAAGKQMNANTEALAGAIDTLFDANAAKSFQGMWAAHVEQLVAYSAATAKKDSAGQESARTTLAGFEKQMAAFLGVATGHKLSDADLAGALTAHDKMLMQHADAYSKKDYRGAHDLAYQTFDHMIELARLLADAFGAEVAARLPKGGAATGYGGEAHVVEHR
jgi:hypothetical protein